MSLPPPLSKALHGSPASLAGSAEYNLYARLSATTTIPIAYAGDGDHYLESVSFVPDTAIAADANDYWSFKVENAGVSGSGSDTVVAAVDTRAGSLNGLTAKDAEDLTIDAAGKVFTRGEVLSLIATKTGAAADVGIMVHVVIRRRVTYS